MKDLTPFQEKLSNAVSIVFVILIFLLLIYIIIVDICNDYKSKEYINSLNEHDKSVIATYKAQIKIYPRSFKKSKKDNYMNSNNNNTSN